MWSNRPAVPIQKNMTKKSKIVPQEDDKNCHSTKYYGSMCTDKKCQATKTSDVWPVKPPIHIQLVTRSSNKRLIGLASDKNCQTTICEYDGFKKSVFYGC